MKASMSPSLEIDIDLTREEFSRLERESLTGVVRLREMPDLEPERALTLVLGTMHSNLFIELEPIPEYACFEESTGYQVVVSQRGYEVLGCCGRLCDRTGGPSRVDIYMRE